MKIHSLELHNFMLHKKFKRKFGDKSIIGFLGDNMSGKTSVIEAVSYCAYGNSRAETETDLIRRGADNMWVKMILSEGKKKYTILRGRDSKNKGLLEIKGIDKKKDAQKVINELLGMDGKEFTLTSFFKQSEINEFMQLGGAKKKEHFMSWLGRRLSPSIIVNADGSHTSERLSINCSVPGTAPRTFKCENT